jgi:cytochrome c peroxidase
MKKKYLLIVLLLAAGVCACSKEIIEAQFKGFEQPSNFPAPSYNFADNAVTQAGFELGRKLFYEPMLSRDNTISCGSCHLQASGFTQHGHTVSHGIDDRLGTRNSQPIMNLAWSTSFMWDGGVFNLDLQPIVPITSHVEMDDSVQHVLVKLRGSSMYREMFKKAYGSDEITTVQFLKSLSQFMVMCVSSNAKYDSVQQGQAAFSVAENQGYNIFKQKCSSCHSEPLFTDHSFRNNGLVPSIVDDKGRFAVTGNTSDEYKFKVPSLRNLGYTAPYMHDGRFLNLSGVMDHYSSQVQLTPNLDPVFTQTAAPGIPLSADEKEKIIAFLHTLDDRTFITDKRFAEQ